MPWSRWLLAIALIFIASLTACGTKSEADVVEDLRVKSNEGESYRSHATMRIQSGPEQHQYEIDVWYQPPHYYRVALKNTGQNVTQVILRNDEGVFVLTPEDNKHFRFQSDWPDAHGQPYLYQTLVQSVIDDENRLFETTDDGYSFDVTANYKQNQALKRQRIRFDKDYIPQQMAILDADDQPLVEVTFEQFETGVTFDEDTFDMERNMKEWGEDAAFATTEVGSAKNEHNVAVDTFTPGWIPEGSELVGEHSFSGTHGEGVLLRYSGEKPFTLLQQPTGSAVPAMAGAVGEPVHLSYTVGVLIEEGDQKQLNWSYQGVDFQLKGALTNEELVKMAEAIPNSSTK